MVSKKQKAFDLFNQGFRPSDTEVKALGLKTKSRFNYYQLWKHSSGGQQVAAPVKGKPMLVSIGKETEEVTEAAILKLVPQVHIEKR